MLCGSPRKSLEPYCSRCGGLFNITPDFKFSSQPELNFPNIKNWVNLGEVTTPIVKHDEAYFKLDYFSPTFSYKDRGARALISFLSGIVPKPSGTVINEDSSGNAGAAIAGYGAKAGFQVNIHVPEKTSQAKITQIKAYGANIIKVAGTREDVQASAERSPGIYASHVMMPEFRDGIRSLAYEIFDQFHGNTPDRIYVPVSAGTLLLGVYSGLKHLSDSGEIPGIPEIIAVQTEQVSPLCARINGSSFDPDAKVSSIADALVSMKPPLLGKMAEALEHGRCITVSENEIVNARSDLAGSGMYVEYSSATVYAAYKKKKFSGSSLLILTGNGLKNTNPQAMR